MKPRRAAALAHIISESVALLPVLRLRVFRLEVFGGDAALPGRVENLLRRLDGAVELVGLRFFPRALAQARELRRDATGGLGELVERLPEERAVGVVLRRVVNVRD